MANKTIGSLPYSIGLRKTNPSDKSSEMKAYPVAQSRETVDLNMLAAHMADHGSPFSRGTIRGVLVDAVEHMVELLRQGYNVKLDGLATLKFTYPAEGVDDAEKLNPTACIKKVNIRAAVDKEAVNALNTNVEFEFVTTRKEQAAQKKASKTATNTAMAAGTSGTGTGSDDGGGDITEGGDVTE